MTPEMFSKSGETRLFIPFPSRWVPAVRACVAAALLAACLPALPAETAPQPPLVRKTLLNELGGVMLRSDQARFALTLGLQQGAVFDPSGKEGLTLVTARYVLERLRQEIEISAQEVGAPEVPESDILVTHDGVRLTARGQSSLLFTVGQALSRVLQSDKYSEPLFLSVRDGLARELEGRERDPAWVAEGAFHTLLYAPFPYARNPNGTALSVRALDLKDMIRHFRRLFMPNRSFVRLVAPLGESEFRRFLIQSFGSWTKGEPLVAQFTPPAADQPVTVFHLAPGARYGCAVVGVECIRRKSEDYPSLWVLFRLLSQRMAGLRVRYPEYRFEPSLEALALRGHVLVRIAGPADFDLEVIGETLGVLSRLADTRLGSADFDRFRDEWRRSIEARTSSTEGFLDLLTEMEWFRLGNGVNQAYLRPMDAAIPEDVPFLARSFFSAGKYRVAVALAALPDSNAVPAALRPFTAAGAPGRASAPPVTQP
ncbi:MAG: insulinase family protein [Acidobacteria bacterium]|nr:insulinase family protein [Acidobacteriota bacterium]